MKLIVGLWNPWDEYKFTRHNLWFLFLDYIFEWNEVSEFKFESKFKWEISTWKIWNQKVILLKPQTYMNLSWESIREVMAYYKLEIEDLIVIYDDMSMDFWKLRFRNKWSAWGHNWIKNIIKFYWEIFDRIKVWIDFNSHFEVSDWVLSKFSSSELDKLPEIFSEAEKLLIEKI